MEQFIKAVGDALDRRSFLRRLGKVGMGAAAMAGVLLLPRQASAYACPGGSKNPCSGKFTDDCCYTGTKKKAGICTEEHNGGCSCDHANAAATTCPPV